MRDDTTPAKVWRYMPFVHIAFLLMQSDDNDRNGADLPAVSEDDNEGGDAATSDRNWHVAKSAGWARWGSATGSALLLVVRLCCWEGRGGGRASSSSVTTMLPLLSTSLCRSSCIVVKIAASADREEECPHRPVRVFKKYLFLRGEEM